jgi:hypothetical protein
VISPDTLIGCQLTLERHFLLPGCSAHDAAYLYILATDNSWGRVAIGSPRKVRKECHVGRCRGPEVISKGWIVMIELRFPRLDASAIA